MTQKSTPYLIIALVGMILFIPFLGKVHLFDWDEINFAECAREMLVTKNYLRVQIDYSPFWEKPPLFIWLQALSMSVFGVNEFAARFPNALAGIITLMVLFRIGKKVAGMGTATFWTILYIASWLPHFYFKAGIIDPIFNLFIFLAFYQIHLLTKTQKTNAAILTGVFLGLAILTKGPVTILIAAISWLVFILLNRGTLPFPWSKLFVVAFSAFVVSFIWFGIEWIKNGPWFMQEFIRYQIRLMRTEDADHGGPFFYHWIVLLIGCFPASALLFQYIGRNRKRNFAPKSKDFSIWMWILFWVVLILFSLVKTKIIHYSSLCYFPLTYLAALKVNELWMARERMNTATLMAFNFLGILLALAITLLPVVGIRKNELIPFFDDPFAVANLNAQVPWSYMECIIGLIYLIAMLMIAFTLRRFFKMSILILFAVQVLVIQLTII